MATLKELVEKHGFGICVRNINERKPLIIHGSPKNNTCPSYIIEGDGGWVDTRYSESDGYELYTEPKKKVKMWLWITLGEHTGLYSLTNYYYEDKKSAEDHDGDKIIGPALWSEIEIDES